MAAATLSWTAESAASLIEKAFGSNDDILMNVVSFIPTVVLRAGFRKLINVRRSKELAKYKPSADADFAAYLKATYTTGLAVATDEANEQHYTCPTEYFDLALGEYKKYSCCVFEEGDTLEDAELRTLRKYCEWLGLAELKDGSTVLDMGCGWGSFTLFAAERFPKLKFTAVSNSPTQREYIMGKAAAKGMRNVEVKTVDLGKEANLESLCGELKGSFSRIISIEMLEHMKRYDKIFEYASRLLKPGAGKMLVHVFCNDRTPYEFDKGWMARNFFTGGNMPSKGLFYQFQDHIHITRTETINGVNYAKTLDAWLERHEANKAKIIEIFEKSKPGSGLKAYTAWWMFYAICSEFFGFDAGSGAGNENFVQLYLFENTHR